MIGERLAEIRKDHGDNQDDLARKLNVSVFAIRSWEQEKSAPSHEMLVRVCRLYQVSSDYPLGKPPAHGPGVFLSFGYFPGGIIPAPSYGRRSGHRHCPPARQ